MGDEINKWKICKFCKEFWQIFIINKW